MEVGFEFREDKLLTFGWKPYHFYTNGKFEWKLGRNGVNFKGFGPLSRIIFLRQRPSKTALETLVIPEKAGTYICYNK